MFGFSAFSSTPFSSLDEVGSQSLSANLFTNSNTFYSARIDIKLFSTYYENTQQFYALTIGTSYELAANRFNNSQIFYAPIISFGSFAQSLIPQRLNNANTFYQLFINRQGEQNVLQGYFENRHKAPKKQEVEVHDYDEELAVLLLMS